MTRYAGDPTLRIYIDVGGLPGRDRAIMTIAHELQHAREVTLAPGVVDSSTLTHVLRARRNPHVHFHVVHDLRGRWRPNRSAAASGTNSVGIAVRTQPRGEAHSGEWSRPG